MTGAEAIRLGTAEAMAKDSSVIVMGLGVPDPKGVFGTTVGLQEEFGANRVFDIPCSENAITGVAIGAALGGYRPILTHQRVDFALLSVEQIVNQAAKWRYMFGGRMHVPLVIRMIVGRGWGQGPQHSQALHAWFAHVPGLKVVLPVLPQDSRDLLLLSVEDDDPVIFIEHRWLHGVKGHVDSRRPELPLGRAAVVREGKDVTIAAFSYMVLEALEAAKRLAEDGISVEVLDMRTARPLDEDTLLSSVRKTGRFVASDIATGICSVGSELVSIVARGAHGSLKSAPELVASPECPTPTSPVLSAEYYPRAPHIVAAVRRTLSLPVDASLTAVPDGVELDKPDPAFTGPF
ncbi:MAG: alpha-ketoacid dehydrogenase subunit beta [Chthoniobacterales bacterium]